MLVVLHATQPRQAPILDVSNIKYSRLLLYKIVLRKGGIGFARQTRLSLVQKSWIFVDVRAEALDEPDAYYGGVCNQREREKRSRVDD